GVRVADVEWDAERAALGDHGFSGLVERERLAQVALEGCLTLGGGALAVDPRARRLRVGRPVAPLGDRGQRPSECVSVLVVQRVLRHTPHHAPTAALALSRAPLIMLLASAG